MKRIFAALIILLLASTAFAGVNATIDVNRDTKVLVGSFTTTTTVETAMSFSVSTNAGSLVSATSYTVSNEKHFRVQAITAACRAAGLEPGASAATLKFKVNGVVQGQPYQVACPTSATASAVAFPSLPAIIPDGIDYEPTKYFTFTALVSAWSTSITPVIDFTLYGYEY